MAEAFIAEIRMFGFNFAPRGWALCNGQLISIASNTALFSLVGTFYGGNGQTTFALPDLQGRAAMHQGQGPGLSIYDLGQIGGSETTSLLQSEIPAHTHNVVGSSGDGLSPSPENNVWAGPGADRNLVLYSASNASPVQMNPTTLGMAGAGLPHNNLMPYAVVNFCIAMQGIFPARP